MKSVMIKGIGKIVLWSGIAVIGVLAIPTGILIGLIAAVWTLTDKILSLIEGGENTNVG